MGSCTMHDEIDMCEPKTGVQSMVEEELHKYNGCLNNWFMCMCTYIRLLEKKQKKKTRQNNTNIH